jgi:predicted RND superfamily exporter protein
MTSPRVLVAVLVTGVLAALMAGGLSRLRVDTSFDSFLPAHDTVAQELDRTARSFGGDPVVVLLESRKSDTLLDQGQLPQLLKLEGTLSQLADVSVVYGPATTLNQTAIKAQNLLAEISGRRDALRESGDKKGAAAFDRRYGALLVRGLPAGLPTLNNPDFVKTVIKGSDNKPRPQWEHLVPSNHAVAIFVRPRQGLDQAGTDRLTASIRKKVDASDLTTSRSTVTGAPVVTADLAGQVRRELPRLGLAALVAVSACLLLVPWVRRRQRRLWPLVPMVVGTALTLACFGWRGTPVSLGAVAFLPVLLGLGSYYPVYLAQREHRRLVLAVAGAAAAAFGSLAGSPLPFVRDLGIAIGLGIVFVVVTTLMLVALRSHKPAPPTSRDYLVVDRTPRSRRVRLPAVLTAVVALVAIAGWGLLPKVAVETDPQRMVTGLSSFGDAKYVEGVLGFSGEVDVVLTGRDVLTPAALRWMRQAEDSVVVDYGNRLRPVASPGEVLRFLGPSPTARQVEAGMSLLPAYLTGAVVTPDQTKAVISFGSEWRSFDEQRALVADLPESMPPPPDGYQVAITGLPVAAVHGFDLVSSGRYLANGLGIVAAGLVLLMGLRRRSDALRAVCSAFVATGLGIFAVWTLGMSLNPITLALGSLTAAVGCEFAVLLATARRTGDARLQRSVLLAAGLSAVGYAVLMLSSLSMVRQFGMVLTGSVGLALLSAVCVTWSIPQGRRIRVEAPLPARVLEGAS